MDDDDRTVVRSIHTHRPELPPESGDEGDTANSLPLGTLLGEFEIKELIGEGGFGIVYLAYDSSLDRMVAIKEFWPASMASRTQAMHVTVRSKRHVDTFKVGLRSFVNEAKLLARFDSPSLVKVFRFWEANGTAYMVMPFYEGLTLRQSLKKGQIVPDEKWLRALLASVLDAMDTIHRERCYHRDIAPDNIMLLRNGRPVLLDFGAARRVIGEATQSLTVILKPGFAPIEQYAETAGLQQGSWTDIYALAAVAYFVIAGKAPPPSVARIVKDDMVPAREVGRGRYSEQFLMVLDHALAVLPANRIQTVANLRDALALDEDVPRTVSSMGRAPATPVNAVNEPREDGWPTEAIRTQGAKSSTHNTAGREEDLGYTDKRVVHPEHTNIKNAKTALVIGSLAVASIAGFGALGYSWMKSPEGTSPDVSAAAQLPSAGKLGSSANASGSAATVAIATSPTPTPSSTATPALGLPATPLTNSSPAATPPVPAAAPLSAEDEFWQAATSKDAPAGYEAYLKRYPRGKYASSAKALLQSRQPNLAALSVPQPAGSSAPAMAVVPGSKSPITFPFEISKPADVKPATAAVQAVTKSEQKPITPEMAQKGPAALAPPVLPPQQTQTAVNAISAQPSPRPADATLAAQVAKSTVTVEPVKTVDADKEVVKPEAVAALSPNASTEPERTIKASDRVLTGSFTLDPTTGIASGSGHVIWNNGDRYDGRLVKGSREGKARYVWANGQSYSGDWSADTPNGRGVFAFANGSRYEGDVRSGVPSGKGLLQFDSGHRYDGEVKGGLPHGQGTIRFKSGETYTGAWFNGKQNGSGRYTWTTGTYWEGEFKDDQKTENGKTVFADGRVVTSSSQEQTTKQSPSLSDDSANKNSTAASAK